MKKVISYTLYPVLLFSIFVSFYFSGYFNWDLATVLAWMAGIRFFVCFTIEFLYPCEKKWKMTWKSFQRDLKWMATGIITFGLIKLAMMMLAIDLSQYNTGLIAGLPLLIEVIICLLVYEFFQYWYHRYSHERRGKLGAWFWRVHVAHHLPDKVYILMHAVFHPINMIFTQIIIQGTLVLSGITAESIFLFNAIMALQGFISHYNVTIKAGFLNYIFIGTELHRYHHSADTVEAKNYGSVISFWDIVFGTFYYKPDSVPYRLGVNNIDIYPESTELFKVLKLPFVKTSV
ncbi:Fatty acid hydroxylase family (carotene hydroxylase/sterol desaturase) [hydrothermal vent metagenome]|uniref:Fatty acid hydroxylase family (Carotene hydroxylase/sterol desaturase) n=1 Tax=hydrothermal vent metagenome TaxID=652676 RepID=A0A3B0VTL6_9ZZZZ